MFLVSITLYHEQRGFWSLGYGEHPLYQHRQSRDGTRSGTKQINFSEKKGSKVGRIQVQFRCNSHTNTGKQNKHNKSLRLWPTNWHLTLIFRNISTCCCLRRKSSINSNHLPPPPLYAAITIRCLPAHHLRRLEMRTPARSTQRVESNTSGANPSPPPPVHFTCNAVAPSSRSSASSPGSKKDFEGRMGSIP